MSGTLLANTVLSNTVVLGNSLLYNCTVVSTVTIGNGLSFNGIATFSPNGNAVVQIKNTNQVSINFHEQTNYFGKSEIILNISQLPKLVSELLSVISTHKLFEENHPSLSNAIDQVAVLAKISL